MYVRSTHNGKNDLAGVVPVEVHHGFLQPEKIVDRAVDEVD